MHRRFLFVVGSFGVLALALFSCTTGTPREVPIDGFTRVYTPYKCLGITYRTAEEDVKTAAQVAVDMEIKAMKDQQRVEAARARVALWIGALLLAAGVACAILGYLTKGWKRWGGLACLCVGACAFCWGFMEWIQYLKWLAVLLPAAAVCMFLYEHREFDIREHLGKRNDTGRKDR